MFGVKDRQRERKWYCENICFIFTSQIHHTNTENQKLAGLENASKLSEHHTTRGGSVGGIDGLVLYMSVHHHYAALWTHSAVDAN